MIRIYSFLLFLIIFVFPHSLDSQKKFFSSLSRKLARSLKEVPSHNKRQAQEQQIIGFLDTFAFYPKFVKMEFLDMIIKDEMKLTCFIDGTCSFAQTFSIDDNEPYYPEAETLATPKLPRIWEALSLLNVEAIVNSYGFSNKMKEATHSLNDLFGAINIFEDDFCLKIGNFSDEITSIIENGMTNVKEQILLELNDTNSDLSLEFQNILAQSFNIIVGLYLQQIASDFQFYDNSMTQILTSIQSDISINLNALQNYADRMDLLANIQNVSQSFFNLSAQFALQFTNYLFVQRDWESIIEGEINTQIINKFNFPDENITQAVRSFLLMIIEGRRALITQSGSLITQQLNQYITILAQHTTSNLNSLNVTLMQLEDSLNQNQDPQSTDPIHSIFENGDHGELRKSLFNIEREIDVYGSLSAIATQQFASVLQQFEDLFMKFISNLPEVIASIVYSFREQYLELIADLQSMNDQKSVDINELISNLWENLYQATNFTFKMISKLNNTSYQLSDEEISIYNAYNLFNDSIVPTLIQIKRNIQYVYSLERNITNFHQSNCQLLVNISGLGQEIQDNLTALQNLIEQKFQNDIENLNNLLLEIDDYLGLTATDNLTDFLMEWNNFIREGFETAFEIIEAVMSDDFTKITFLDQNVINTIAFNFNGTFDDFHDKFSDNALEFEVVNNKVLVDFSGNGMQSQLNTSFHFHHIINGHYGIDKNGCFSRFFFDVIPFIFVHVDIINTLQEFYLMQQIITTNIDLLNGKFPISYHLNGDFVEGEKNIATFIKEIIQMDDLGASISESVGFFLRHDNSITDPILLQQSNTIPEDEQSQEQSISK